MGHTNSTANLSLPQFIGTDKPTWLGDVNGAFSDIDAYVGTNDAAVAAAASDASSAISQAASAVSTANAANTTAGNASTAATNAVTVANNAVAIAGVVDTKVGLLADLTTTDRTSIVNAINEVNSAVGTVPTAAQVTYDNTGSGLTATNVQDAIDEVAQGGGGTLPAWTQIGQETGTSNPVSIPGTATEIHVQVESTSNDVYFSETIPVASLSATTKEFVTGYYRTSSAYGFCKVNISSASVQLSDLQYAGSSIASTAVITLFAR